MLISFFSCASAYAINITAQDVLLDIKSEPVSIKDGQKISTNLYFTLKLPKKWYTYYQNGGDTGLGADITYNNRTLKTSELNYANPKKYIDSGFANYVYFDQAKFSQNITQNTNNVNNLNKSINGSIEFLVCNNVCIPLTKEFHIHNPFKKSKLSINKETFKTEKLNKNLDFTVEGKYLYIKLNKELENAKTFIPNEDGLINDLANQEVVTYSNIKYLKVELDEFLDYTIQKLNGLIQTTDKTYKVSADNKDINLKSFSEKLIDFALIALFAVFGGIILNLMPCVLPVIGLKAYSLAKNTEKADRLKSAFIYCAGVFTSMMLIVALLLSLKAFGANLAWGFQLQNHAFVMFMIAVLVILGFNFLGFISIGDKLSAKASIINMKHSGDFFTGVLATVIGTPCTAPFMATSIGFALTSNSNLIAIIIFSFLALGVCLPIIAIAFIPKASNLLPKSGDWNTKFKQFLAFPIFATAVWLVWVLDASMIYTNIAIALFTFGFITWLFTLKTKVKYVVIAITLFVSFNMFSIKKSAEIESLEFNKQTIEELNNKGQHVFVDFTAKWCLTCQYNKKTVLTSEEFINTLKKHNIKFMIADWTDKDSNISTELASLGRSGVPVYAIYNAHTKQALVLPEILTNKAVKEAISKLE